MKQDYDLDMIEGWDGDYGEITYLTKTSMRAPRGANGDEVVSFSDDIEMIEIPRLGQRRAPRRHGRVNNINIDGNSYDPRHDEGPDDGGAASTV